MKDEERKAQDKCLENMNKKIQAARVQQDLCQRVFRGGLLDCHGYDPGQLGVDIMTLNTHNAIKACYFALSDNKIPFGDNNPYEFSHLVSNNAYNYKNKDPNKPKGAYSGKAKRLRELAELFATMADSFDIIDKWADGVEDE